jgi:sortase A
LFLWLGVAVLAYAGSMATYAGIYQWYQSQKFEHQQRLRMHALHSAALTDVAASKGFKAAHEPAANASPTRSASAIERRLKKGRSHQDIAEEAVDLREGDVVGKLDVPRIGISVMVLQGIGKHTLIAGAGHVPGTPLPGAEGNAAIAAHRDTFFRKLEAILPGDSIQVATEGGTYDYVVHSTEVVDPEDTRVMESRSHTELTLITCYPFYFVGAAPKRFVVHALPTK